ncbi:MAG: NFYB/HAP3 family transcription factor subunit [Candidatus Micrarchaeaceae archaeon]
MRKGNFSLYDIEEFIREAGAEKVTEDAVRDLERIVERMLEGLAKKAVIYAKHAGRNRRIKANDIRLLESSYKIPVSLNEKPKTRKRSSINEI